MCTYYEYNKWVWQKKNTTNRGTFYLFILVCDEIEFGRDRGYSSENLESLQYMDNGISLWRKRKGKSVKLHLKTLTKLYLKRNGKLSW